MFRSFINRYYRSYKFYGRRSPWKFCNYLRANGVTIGNNVNFRYPKSACIDLTRPYLIEIGNNVDINANFTIMTHDFGTYVFRNLYGDFVASSGHVKIGNNIYFGRDVTILKGVEIGDNCIIGVGSIVTRNIPSNSVVAGAPARVICSIEDYYKKRKQEQVDEAIQLGKILYNKYGHRPQISNFKEEWSVFISKEDLIKYPEMLPLIKFRLRDNLDSFLSTPPISLDTNDL